MLSNLPAFERPEIKLLLCCARKNLDAETKKQVEHWLQQAIDWDYLLALADQHSVTPLLYQSLKQARPEVVPETVLAQLQADFQAIAVRNLYLTKELLSILNLCQKHDIPALPYKGPALAAFLYGNVTFRTFCDLDILVRKEDFFQVKDLLIAQGYQPRYVGLDDENERAYYQAYCEYSLVSADGEIFIDLHQALAQPHVLFPYPVEDLWQSLTSVSLAGTVVEHIGAEDLLLLLCIHGCKDFWRELKWICDIAELINTQTQIDWQRVMQQAKHFRSDRRLRLGLLLAHDLLGIELPEPAWHYVEIDPESRSLAHQVYQWLFCNADHLTLDITLKRLIFQFSLMERPTDKLRSGVGYMLHVISPKPTDWTWLPLPRSLYFCYYFLRPVRLIYEHGWMRLGVRC
jgi:hypothetical protein